MLTPRWNKGGTHERAMRVCTWTGRFLEIPIIGVGQFAKRRDHHLCGRVDHRLFLRARPRGDRKELVRSVGSRSVRS